MSSSSSDAAPPAPAGPVAPAQRTAAGTGAVQPSIVGGVDALKAILIVGFVLAFVAVYAYFIERIWAAGAASKPQFDTSLIAIAGTLSGILGSGFALAIGVARPDDAPAPKFVPQRIADKFKGLSITMTLGIWAYALVGGAACVTALLNRSETPDVVNALAAVFGGYILTLASGMFRSIRSAA